MDQSPFVMVYKVKETAREGDYSLLAQRGIEDIILSFRFSLLNSFIAIRARQGS